MKWSSKYIVLIFTSLLLFAGCTDEPKSNQELLTKELKLLSDYSKNIDTNYNLAMQTMKSVSTGSLTLSEASDQIAEQANNMDTFIVLIANSSVEKSKKFDGAEIQKGFAVAAENLWRGYKLKHAFVSDAANAFKSNDYSSIGAVIEKHDGFAESSQSSIMMAMVGFADLKNKLGLGNDLDEFQ